MSILAKNRVNQVWSQITQPRTLCTPSRKKPFSVVKSTPNDITIEVGSQGESRLVITRDQFESTIDYLNQNGHGLGMPCRLDSSNSPDKAGPLCLACRTKSASGYGPRVITYILPILESVGVVGIDGKAPASTWLV